MSSLSSETIKIEFVNQKSVKSLQSIVSRFKEKYIPLPSVEHNDLPSKSLAILHEHPEIVTKNPSLFNIPIINPDSKAVTKQTKTSTLHPFLIPFQPASISKSVRKENSVQFESERRKFLIEARIEHQRILLIFQDRLAFEVSTCPLVVG
jgi:hypothetical protein